jgi:hypothetical protein
MKTATGLALVAIGAILAFAVTASTSWLNLHVAGWVIMATGAAGLFIPRRGYGWMRRRLVPRTTYMRMRPNGQTEIASLPPYVRENPGTAARDAGLPVVPSIPPDPSASPGEQGVPGTVVGPATSRAHGTTEVIEEYFEDPDE